MPSEPGDLLNFIVFNACKSSPLASKPSQFSFSSSLKVLTFESSTKLQNKLSFCFVFNYFFEFSFLFSLEASFIS